jgi:hypothetical protein
VEDRCRNKRFRLVIIPTMHRVYEPAVVYSSGLLIQLKIHANAYGFSKFCKTIP